MWVCVQVCMCVLVCVCIHCECVCVCVCVHFVCVCACMCVCACVCVCVHVCACMCVCVCVFMLHGALKTWHIQYLCATWSCSVIFFRTQRRTHTSFTRLLPLGPAWPSLLWGWVCFTLLCWAPVPSLCYKTSVSQVWYERPELTKYLPFHCACVNEHK